MRKLITVIAATTALASGVAVLQLKSAVQHRVDNLKTLSVQMKQDREAIRVLEAEWAYLTTPRVLQERSIQFLALMPPRAKQIVSDPALIPFRPRGVGVDSETGVLLPVAAQKKPTKKKETKKDKEQSL